MAKEKETKRNPEVIEQENIILRKQLEDANKLLAENARHPKPVDDLTSEIRKIKAKSKPSVSSILVKEITDHKNISLWNKLGKRIGPMHPDNAIQTLYRFADLGIILTSDQPTQKDIEDYKKTDEYKAWEKSEADRRAVKDKSRKSGQIEKLAREIAKMSGTTVEAINHILKAHEIKPLSEAR